MLQELTSGENDVPGEVRGFCHGKETVDRHEFDAAGSSDVEGYSRTRLSAVPRIVASTTASCGRFAEDLSHKRPTL